MLELTEHTRTINAVTSLGGYIDAMPRRCITVGMRQILQARAALLHEPPLAARHFAQNLFGGGLPAGAGVVFADAPGCKADRFIRCAGAPRRTAALRKNKEAAGHAGACGEKKTAKKRKRQKTAFPLRGKRLFCFCACYLPNISAARRMFSMMGTWNGQRVWHAPQAMQSPACAPSSA